MDWTALPHMEGLNAARHWQSLDLGNFAATLLHHSRQPTLLNHHSVLQVHHAADDGRHRVNNDCDHLTTSGGHHTQ
jgi:hypothetical protein